MRILHRVFMHKKEHSFLIVCLVWLSACVHNSPRLYDEISLKQKLSPVEVYIIVPENKLRLFDKHKGGGISGNGGAVGFAAEVILSAAIDSVQNRPLYLLKSELEKLTRQIAQYDVENRFKHQLVKQLAGVDWLTPARVSLVRTEPVIYKNMLGPTGSIMLVRFDSFFTFAHLKFNIKSSVKLVHLADHSHQDTGDEPDNRNALETVYTTQYQTEYQLPETEGAGMDYPTRIAAWNQQQALLLRQQFDKAIPGITLWLGRELNSRGPHWQVRFR